tara:strand:- start:349 stop:618 length:270 start_codon:yes stop_codon:yes gene_type:complete
VTVCLKTVVAVRVAATDTKAVVAAVVKIVGEGKGTSISVPGISTKKASGGTGGLIGGGGGFFAGCCPSSSLPLTPGGGLRSLGGTTRGL